VNFRHFYVKLDGYSIIRRAVTKFGIPQNGTGFPSRKAGVEKQRATR